MNPPHSPRRPTPAHGGHWPTCRPGVRAAGVHPHLLVLFEPVIQGVPVEAHEVAQLLDRRIEMANRGACGHPITGLDVIELTVAADSASASSRRWQRGDQSGRPRPESSSSGSRGSPTRAALGSSRRPQSLRGRPVPISAMARSGPGCVWAELVSVMGSFQAFTRQGDHREHGTLRIGNYGKPTDRHFHRRSQHRSTGRLNRLHASRRNPRRRSR